MPRVFVDGKPCVECRQGPPRVGCTMPRCDHCDAHVSDRFARVFADDAGQLLACPNCSANAGIAEVSRDRAYERP